MVEEEEEEDKDPVWRAYRGVESIAEDELLREIVEKRSDGSEGR